MKDVGLTISIIVFFLVIALVIGSIIYGIYNESVTCYDVKVVSVDGDVGFYHCISYDTAKDSYILHFHDYSKIVLMKNDISNITIVEVKDNERKK